MERFRLNIKGQSTGLGHESVPVLSPNETVNYDSAHDDLCLWDKLRRSATEAPEALRIGMDKLAAGIVLTAQGVPFLHSGDEFLRSKNFNRNSYNSTDPRVNPLDWSLKAKHKDVFDFYRGMIALRRAHPAFRMTDRAQVDQTLEFAPGAPAKVVAYVLKNHANGDSWKTILVIYNGNKEAQDVAVGGDWAIVANDQCAGTATLGSARNRVHVAPFSLLVAHTEGAYRL
jgi:pullulanase